MLRRILVLAIAALVVWRVAALGLSSHYAEELKGGDTGAAAKALAWNGRQPEALLAQATALREQDPATAVSLLGRAYAENPANARPLITIARLAQQQGDQHRADDLVKAAVQLMPADPWVHQQAAGYWASRGDLDQAMQHWSLALEADPNLGNQVFPILLAVAEDPRTRPAFKPFATTPPSWWEAFFAEVAKRALDVEPVRLLFALRRESAGTPITERERQTYVSRLIQDGRISEAYIEWINGLNRAQRAQLGLLHDGGFELESSSWGFDWHFHSTPRALVDRARTYGIDGDKALHVLFERQEQRFADVYQTLFLDPGVYHLTGRVRTDSLDTQGGLKWTLRCLSSEERDLAESERFLGANEWRDFAVEFQIPESCVLQEIRLVSAGKQSFEHKISGGAWFDRMAIRRLPGPEPAAAPGGVDAVEVQTSPKPKSVPVAPTSPQPVARPIAPPALPKPPIAPPALGALGGPEEVSPQGLAAATPAIAPQAAQGNAPGPEDAAPAETPAAPAATADAGTASQVAGDRGVVLEFRGPCWVDIRDAAKTFSLKGEMAKGDRRVLGGTPPYDLKLGNAAAVAITVNGIPFDIARVARTNSPRFKLDPTKPQ